MAKAMSDLFILIEKNDRPLICPGHFPGFNRVMHHALTIRFIMAFNRIFMHLSDNCRFLLLPFYANVTGTHDEF